MSTRRESVLKELLVQLHKVEHDLELANALTHHDPAVNAAEIVLHECITRVERIEQDRGEEPRCTGVLVHSEYERCPRCDR